MKIIHSFILVCSLFFMSCASKEKIKSPSFKDNLTNSEWQIIKIRNSPIKDKVNGAVPKLVFDNSNYSVITGCNTLNGEFTLSSNNIIKFYNGISTMMYCDNMVVEDGFKGIISDISSYILKDDTLALTDNEGVTLAQFKRFGHDDIFSLKNSSWTLDLLSAPGVDFKQLFADKYPTLSFDEQLNISGNASCNNYRSTIKIKGSSIHLGPIASTKMLCPNIKGEAIYLETLSKVNHYSFNENVLTLLIDDVAVMRFKKQ